eukprot:g5359.t1
MSSTVLSRVKGAKRWAKQTFGFKFKDCDVELKKVQPSSSAPSLYVSYKGKQRKLSPPFIHKMVDSKILNSVKGDKRCVLQFISEEKHRLAILFPSIVAAQEWREHAQQVLGEIREFADGAGGDYAPEEAQYDGLSYGEEEEELELDDENEVPEFDGDMSSMPPPPPRNTMPSGPPAAPRSSGLTGNSSAVTVKRTVPDNGPKISVNHLEEWLQDQGLVKTVTEAEEYVDEMRRTLDPSRSGRIGIRTANEFVAKKRSVGNSSSSSSSSSNPTSGVASLEPVPSATLMEANARALSEHIGGTHFERLSVKWDTHHEAYGEVNSAGSVRDTLERQVRMQASAIMSDSFGQMEEYEEDYMNFDQEWNEQYQSALELPELRYADAIAKGFKIHRLTAKLARLSKIAARTIVDEFSLPKTLKKIQPLDWEPMAPPGSPNSPSSPSSSTEEILFEYRGLLLRLIGPSAGEAEQETLRKVAGNELRGIVAVQEAATTVYQNALVAMASKGSSKNKSKGRNGPASLHVVVSFIVDYCGFRFLVMAIPPVDEERTQVYGRIMPQDPNSSWLERDRTTSVLLEEVSRELNLKPHTIIADGKAKTIAVGVEVQGHLCQDGRRYCMNLSRIMPPDLPSGGADIVTKLLRPELVKAYSSPLSADAFSSIIAPPQNKESESLLSDASANDVNAGKASQYLLQQRIPDFIASLDLLEIFPYDSQTFTQAIHTHGINARHIGRIAERTVLPHVRDMVVCEMLARTAKDVLNENQRRIIVEANVLASGVIKELSKQKASISTESMAKLYQYNEQLKEDIQQNVVDFFNLVLGSPVNNENRIFWEKILLPRMALKFGYSHMDEGDPQRVSRRHVSPHLLFHALQHHCGVAFVASSHYAFDEYALPLQRLHLLDPHPRVKSTSMHNASLDINQVAASAEVEKERKRYLIALQAFRLRLFPLRSREGREADIAAARVLNEIAEMFRLDHSEPFLPEKDRVRPSLQRALEYTVEALKRAPKSHAVAARVHATRMRIFFERKDEANMLKEFAAAMRAVLAHYGNSGNHPLVCELHCVLGSLYKELGNGAAAKNHLDIARSKAAKILGAGHPLLASYATQLAHVCAIAGDHDEAIEYHQQALLIYQSTVGPESLEAAASYFYMAEAQAQRASYDTAFQLAQTSLRLREGAVRDGRITADNESILNSYYQVAAMCVDVQQHAQATECYERVLDGLRGRAHQNEQTLADMQKATKEIVMLKTIMLPSEQMRELQRLLSKHKPERLNKLAARDAAGKLLGGKDEQLLSAFKRTLLTLSSGSPTAYFDKLVDLSKLRERSLNSSSAADGMAYKQDDAFDNDMEVLAAERELVCLITLTTEADSK